MVASVPDASLPSGVADAMFDRLEASAIAENDRRQALEFRYSYHRSEGQTVDADRALRRLEATFGPQPQVWVLDYLYWDGLEAPAVEAASSLAERVPPGPLPWTEGGRDACVLELWRLRLGDDSVVDETVRRLRSGSDDPDPAHGRNALCALTLETMAAHRRGGPDADGLVARLTAALDAGPPDFAPVILEAAWILEDRGDLAAAARVAGYMYLGTPFLFAVSTRHRESARLWDEAGEPEKAAEQYRWFLAYRDVADPEFREETEAARNRLSELEGGR